MKQKNLFGVLKSLGSLLPHPVTLFIGLILILFLISAICSYFDLSIVDPRDSKKSIAIVNLLSMQEIVYFATHFVSNFTNFPPLGSALIAMLGVGIAEASGLLGSLIKAVVLNTPKKLITLIIVFSGIMSNVASDVGYVVLIPLAAMIFHSLGRHPLAGIAAAFAGVSGGYGANLLVGTIDPILSGITQQAARIVDPTYVVGVESNWYFMTASTFLIAFLGYWVTEKIVEPRLGKYQDEGKAEEKVQNLTALEKKALWFSGIAFFIYVVIVCLLILPQESPFRNPKTHSLIGSPFFSGLIFFVFFFFAIPGIVYGVVVKKFLNDKSVIEAMSESLKGMSMYFVIIFFAAQFIALFSQSKLGAFLAIKGSLFLQSLDLNAGILLVGFVLICAFINLMVASASAQWALTAPIFVPILMNLGYAPEVIQAAYRIGDSVTNIITPMLAYLSVILVVAMRYKKDVGIGSIISLMFPYSLVFLIGWCALLYVWVFVLNLPVGPGAETFYKVAS